MCWLFSVFRGCVHECRSASSFLISSQRHSLTLALDPPLRCGRHCILPRSHCHVFLYCDMCSRIVTPFHFWAWTLSCCGRHCLLCARHRSHDRGTRSRRVTCPPLQRLVLSFDGACNHYPIHSLPPTSLFVFPSPIPSLSSLSLPFCPRQVGLQRVRWGCLHQSGGHRAVGVHEPSGRHASGR